MDKTDANNYSPTTYRDHAVRGAWMGRGVSLWAFSILGLVAGASMGALAPLIPLALGMTIPLTTLGSSILIYGAVGMAAGFGVANFVGSAAGAAADVAREQEKRLLARDAALGLPTPEKGLPASTIKPQKLVNLKVGVMMATLGMIGGLIMGGAFLALGPGATAAVPAFTTLMGAAAAESTAATLAYFTGVMGMFGSLWTFNFPQIAYKMHDTVSRYIGGAAIGTSWDLPDTAPAKTAEKTPTIAFAPSSKFQDLLNAQQQNTRELSR